MQRANRYPFNRLVFEGMGLLMGIIFFWGCAQTAKIGAPVDPARLKDGVYAGSHRGGPNKVDVRVEIRGKRIVAIEIVQHQAWKGKKAETAIVERIIANQSTDVDAVSGATNSSRVIMNAVQDAIEKAYQN